MATSPSPATAARIRHATEADAAELARLRWQWAREDGEVADALEDFTDGFRDFVRRALVSGRWAIWVADLDGRLVGNAWVELVDRVPRPDAEKPIWGYVTNVYVEPEARNQGLGGMLLDAAVEWGRYVGADVLVAWPGGAAVSLYERRGFVRSREARELRFGE